jgi:hypothetical protein
MWRTHFACRVEIRLDACPSNENHTQTSVETILDAADTECPRHGMARAVL